MEIQSIILICLGCNLNFNILKRKPIALPCGHSFCNTCVDSSYKATSYIKCWTCYKKHFHELQNLNINHMIYIFLLNQKEIIFKKQENLNQIKFSFFKNTIVKCHEFSIFSKVQLSDLELTQIKSPFCEKFSLNYNFHKNNAVLFYYFDIMKQILLKVDTIIDPNEHATFYLISNYKINFLLKTIIVWLILVLNYYLGKLNLLYEFYLVTTLTYESILVNRVAFSCCLNTNLNRWISLFIYLLINFSVNFTSLNSLIILDNLYTSLTTIYVLLVVGSDSELYLILGSSCFSSKFN
jgi:hypothetical protein